MLFSCITGEQPDENSSSPASRRRRDSFLGELQTSVDQRFASIDLRDRVSRDTSKRIGFGTYGDVYQGTLQPNQQEVAVKVVRCGDKSARPALEGVLREVYVWSKLRHENIIELLGITTAFDNTISIVSPLMSRGNAFDYVQNLDVDPRPLILGIANGLYYLHMHEQGPVVHGDIKGLNVLISEDGHALLTDFGFSHLSQASFSLAAKQRPGGTLNWMPPEYLEADEYEMTTAGDVWAFGMTALELLTRKRPFHHLNTNGAIMYHIFFKARERPSPDVSCSFLTDKWWNLCLSCWVRDPNRRPSMSSVVKNIRHIRRASFLLKVRILMAITRPLHRQPRTSDTSRPSHDPKNILEELSRSASHYSIVNLDGRVTTNSEIAKCGGSAIVRLGTLSSSELAAVTPIDNGFPCGEKATQVKPLVNHHGLSQTKETKVAIRTPRGALGDVEHEVSSIVTFISL